MQPVFEICNQNNIQPVQQLTHKQH